jgi:hypothetical protein
VALQNNTLPSALALTYVCCTCKQPGAKYMTEGRVSAAQTLLPLAGTHIGTEGGLRQSCADKRLSDACVGTPDAHSGVLHRDSCV